MIFEQSNCTTNNLFAIFNNILLYFDLCTPHKVEGCCINCPLFNHILNLVSSARVIKESNSSNLWNLNRHVSKKKINTIVYLGCIQIHDLN